MHTLAILCFIAVLLVASTSHSQVASQSRNLTLQQIAVLRGGTNQWISVVIIRDGKPISVSNKTFKPDAPTVVLESNDLIAFNEAADSLQKWSSAHPNKVISPAEIETLPAGTVIRADGIPIKSIEKTQLRTPTTASQAAERIVLPNANQRENIQVLPSLQSPKTIASNRPSPREEPASSKPWSIIVVLVVAAGGLLWLLLKQRN